MIWLMKDTTSGVNYITPHANPAGNQDLIAQAILELRAVGQHVSQHVPQTKIVDRGIDRGDNRGSKTESSTGCSYTRGICPKMT